MNKILLVEDSNTFGSLVVRTIDKNLQVPVDWVKSFAQAKELLATTKEHYTAAILDLNLPDAPQGEVVDLVLSHHIPSIVLTGELDDQLKDEMWSKRIADYIIKESIDVIDYLLLITRRLITNLSVGVIVVDDSSTFRLLLTRLLESHNYRVISCQNGQEALAALRESEDVKLVIADYNMPGMNGYELTREIRKTHKRDQLSIIGISAHGNPEVSSRFIKSGANDFLSKPFTNEEFYCRVMQNVELIEQFDTIKDNANKDYLTKLFNRRYLFDAGGVLFENHRRSNLQLTVAMLDIDHFKKVNDTYGHDAGDAVIRNLAAVLSNRFRQSDIVARFGGEEFCVLAANMDESFCQSVFEGLREQVESEVVMAQGCEIRYTVSVGVYSGQAENLDALVKQADLALYQAKNTGRNKVVVVTG